MSAFLVTVHSLCTVAELYSINQTRCYHSNQGCHQINQHLNLKDYNFADTAVLSNLTVIGTISQHVTNIVSNKLITFFHDATMRIWQMVKDVRLLFFFLTILVECSLVQQAELRLFDSKAISCSGVQFHVGVTYMSTYMVGVFLFFFPSNKCAVYLDGAN